MKNILEKAKKMVNDNACYIIGATVAISYIIGFIVTYTIAMKRMLRKLQEKRG